MHDRQLSRVIEFQTWNPPPLALVRPVSADDREDASYLILSHLLEIGAYPLTVPDLEFPCIHLQSGFLLTRPARKTHRERSGQRLTIGRTYELQIALIDWHGGAFRPFHR